MSDKPLAGKTGIVFGVANKRSIAWAIAQAWAEAGANLIFNYQGERLKDNVEQLGAGIINEFIALKRMEWVEYQRQVTEWERERYAEFF